MNGLSSVEINKVTYYILSEVFEYFGITNPKTVERLSKKHLRALKISKTEVYGGIESLWAVRMGLLYGKSNDAMFLRQKLQLLPRDKEALKETNRKLDKVDGDALEAMAALFIKPLTDKEWKLFDLRTKEDKGRVVDVLDEIIENNSQELEMLSKRDKDIVEIFNDIVERRIKEIQLQKALKVEFTSLFLEYVKGEREAFENIE